VAPLLSVTLFILLGFAFVLGNLTLGWFLRPRNSSPEKSAAYECGEPTMGPSWVQFDLRFYIIGLLFLVFDVEVALFYPWAVVYGNAGKLAKAAGISLFQYRQAALVDMLLFFGLLLLGFAYLWRFGYLDWVRVQRKINPVTTGIVPTATASNADAPSPSQPLVPA
jgi:NADH-quinone oxidoreductase subunit A